jgi:hypothetical protein
MSPRRAAVDDTPRERVRYQGEVWEVAKVDGKYAYIERKTGKDLYGRFAPLANLTALDVPEVVL